MIFTFFTREETRLAKVKVEAPQAPVPKIIKQLDYTVSLFSKITKQNGSKAKTQTLINELLSEKI